MLIENVAKRKTKPVREAYLLKVLKLPQSISQPLELSVLNLRDRETPEGKPNEKKRIVVLHFIRYNATATSTL